MIRFALWLLVVVDVLVLSSAVLTNPLGPEGYRVVSGLVTYLLAVAQVGAVLLALRWRARTAPAPSRSLPAMTVLGLALLFNVVGLLGGAMALSFAEYRALGLGAVVWTLANTVALVAAWRWRPWARASPAAG